MKPMPSIPAQVRSRFSWGFLAALLLGVLLPACVSSSSVRPLGSGISIRTEAAMFTLDGQGAVTGIYRNADGRNYLPAGQPAPLLQLRVGGKDYAPDAAAWDASAGRLFLRYDAIGGEAVVKVDAKSTHTVFELVEARPLEKIDLVRWGPYPTTIRRVIGELVGVVRDGEFAVGIQALNAKTQGGVPCADSWESNRFRAVNAATHDAIQFPAAGPVAHYGSVAQAAPFGSVLQMHAWEHERGDAFFPYSRNTPCAGHAPLVKTQWPGETVVGSRIALFACPEPQVLETLGKIELAEGLPHILVDGEWAKTKFDREPLQQFCFEFGEGTIDDFIAVAQKADIDWIYHNSAWASWGHFPPKPGMFPHGYAGLKACVQKAHAARLKVGMHTLSMFITADDPYVTQGDPRLASAQTLKLAKEIGPDDTVIELDGKPVYGPNCNVRIGNEIIGVARISAAAPWRLEGLFRGNYGSARSAHRAGDDVARCLTFNYGKAIFLPGRELGREIAGNCARIVNEAGLDQWEFDGLESNAAFGVGGYGRNLFLDDWRQGLDPARRNSVILGSSAMDNLSWHTFYGGNWGEPWYDSFRKSMIGYRLEMVRFQARNYLPRMLGQFVIHPDGRNASVADLHWLMAVATGYRAGFSLTFDRDGSSYMHGEAASPPEWLRVPQMDQYLAVIRTWREADKAGVFTPELRARLQDWTREFQLEPAGQAAWDLYPVDNGRRGEPIRLQAKAR